MTICRWVWILLAFFFLICQIAVGAEMLTPLETLKVPFNKIITLLNDDSVQTPDQKLAQREKIWHTAQPLFDFKAISRRTVGKAWNQFSETEQSRFTKVFSKFLGNTYIDKIQGEFSNERIVFDTELVKGTKAIARTRLLRESLEIPIDYRMKQINGQWKIYDILVENGISLVKNYRSQFRSILQKETPAQLIQRLEKKLEAQQQLK